jgi:hypothetical protein
MISESSGPATGVGEAVVWLAVELPFNDKSFVNLTAAAVVCHSQQKNKKWKKLKVTYFFWN